MKRHISVLMVIIVSGNVEAQEWNARPYHQYESQDYPLHYGSPSEPHATSQQPREINSAFFSSEVVDPKDGPPGPRPGAWEFCVKMCVRFDPKTGRVTFTGGDLDCLTHCQRKFGNSASAGTSLGLPSVGSHEGVSPFGSTPTFSSTSSHQWNPRSNTERSSLMTSGLPTTPEASSYSNESSSRQQSDAIHTTSYLQCGLKSCKKIAEFDSRKSLMKGSNTSEKVIRDFTKPEMGSKAGGEQKDEVNAIYSRLLQGWKVLEDICEVFSRAKQYGDSGSGGLSDKEVMCNVLLATGKANFNKEDCLNSAEVDDLLKGCKQLAKSKSASRNMILKIAGEMNQQVSRIKENRHKDPGLPQRKGSEIDFRSEVPTTFSKIQADLAAKTREPLQLGEIKVERGPDQKLPTAHITATFPLQESASFLPESQKWSMCINAELLKSKEVDAIKNLTESIEHKQDEIEHLEGQVDGGPRTTKLVVEAPQLERTLKEVSKKLNRTKLPKPQQGAEELSRLSCLKDFIMLRKTMNEILLKLEDKYRALLKEKQTTIKYEDFGADPVAQPKNTFDGSSSKNPENGSFNQGHVYYDQQLPSAYENYVDYYPSQLKRRQQTIQSSEKPGNASIVGLLQVDPNGHKNGTMTITHLNQMSSKDGPQTYTTGFAANRLWPGRDHN